MTTLLLVLLLSPLPPPLHRRARRTRNINLLRLARVKITKSPSTTLKKICARAQNGHHRYGDRSSVRNRSCPVDPGTRGFLFIPSLSLSRSNAPDDDRVLCCPLRDPVEWLLHLGVTVPPTPFACYNYQRRSQPGSLLTVRSLTRIKFIIVSSW